MIKLPCVAEARCWKYLARFWRNFSEYPGIPSSFVGNVTGNWTLDNTYSAAGGTAASAVVAVNVDIFRNIPTAMTGNVSSKETSSVMPIYA